ncbi:hypothetical protein EYF80_021836 [Liparis tanakae]|uniref:Uncharacterized protein n=1 Tax=Liparis tanakae TaxID=230148 RepID=A0A4Z2HQ16_9TELE|nr:hypothetical protein EYF80_021836 [Liparis tanakae]
MLSSKHKEEAGLHVGNTSSVLALGCVAAVLGHLGTPQLALALPQLGHVALEAQAELGDLSPGRAGRPLLQVDPLHVHHLLDRRFGPRGYGFNRRAAAPEPRCEGFFVNGLGSTSAIHRLESGWQEFPPPVRS